MKEYLPYRIPFLPKKQNTIDHPIRTGRSKLGLILCLLIGILVQIHAQKGPFIKFSIGPGISTEYSNLHASGVSLVTKNHAIGWGLNNRFALQVGEFGGLIRQEILEYKYINLDAFGVGLSYRLPGDVSISLLGAYGTVALAHQWT